MAQLLPIYLDLTERPVLVVGGGTVASRKVALLLERDIRVTVVAPDICPQLKVQADNPGLAVHQRPYQSADLADHWLVISATDDPQLNRTVAADADRVRIFCNVVDQPSLCTFQVPAVLRRGLLQIAVSTGGASPALAARLRRQLEDQFGPAYAELLEALLDLRNHLKQKYPQDQAKRREILESFLDSPATGLLLEREDRDSFRAELKKHKAR